MTEAEKIIEQVYGSEKHAMADYPMTDNDRNAIIECINIALNMRIVSRSKPKDTNYRSGIVNLEFIKEDSEGVYYKATPIEEEFTQGIEDKTLS